MMNEHYMVWEVIILKFSFKRKKGLDIYNWISEKGIGVCIIARLKNLCSGELYCLDS